jgi:acetylornithine/N-succinyldiaminopimelate aminotransferase
VLTAARSPELPVYPRLALEPQRGSGSTLLATDGREVLDLYGGHAVAVSGHCHPKVVAAVREQAERLLFYSNAVPLAVRDRVHELLDELAPPGLEQCFLVNSGAEANDVALQLARRITGRRRLVVMEGGFHGRSLATLAASGLPHYRKLAEKSGGQALVDLTAVAPFDDPGALAGLVDAEVAAVLLEPVQGLAGARELRRETLLAARRACDAAGALLLFDEVQCGCGRTGAFTAAEAYGCGRMC